MVSGVFYACIKANNIERKEKKRKKSNQSKKGRERYKSNRRQNLENTVEVG